MKQGCMIIAIAMVLGVCCACNNKQRKYSLSELAGCIAKLDEQDDEDLGDNRSLNDIRFANYKTNYCCPLKLKTSSNTYPLCR